MTEPTTLGVRALTILAFVAERLRDNDGAGFDAARFIVGDDKAAALELIKRMNHNDSLVKDIVVLLQAKKIKEAEELVSNERARQRRLQAGNGGY